MINRKRWHLLRPDIRQAKRLSDQYNIHIDLAKILVNRGIVEDQIINPFIQVDKEQFHGPYLLKDMERSVVRIIQAIGEGEKVTIYGDYDVDGITSTSMLYLFLSSINTEVDYYIPDRFDEGYGINNEALNKIKARGTSLVISVDTGIVAHEQALYARSIGLDLIITDHHESDGILPEAFAVINPKRPEARYPFDMLAGVGVAFKLIHAIAIDMDIEKHIWPYLHLAAVGTVADIVPLVEENRIITKLAFKDIGNTWNIGLDTLIDVAGVDRNKFTAADIGYKIGPRLNSAGRMGDAGRGVELLTTSNRDRAIQLSKELNDENIKRQSLEKQICDEAIDKILEMGYEKDRIIVISGQGWSHGVIGIAASRIKDRFYRPTIILTEEDGIASGSARSVKGFNLHTALSSCKSLFKKFGGHAMAAGMSLDAEYIDELRILLNDYAEIHLSDDLLIPELEIDFEVPFEEVTTDYISRVQTLEPYGAGNPEPVFLIKGKVNQIKVIGKERTHLKLLIASGDQVLDCIGFSMSEVADYLKPGMMIQVAGMLSINEWQGNKKPNIMIDDIRYKDEDEEKLKRFVHMIEHMDEDHIQLINQQGIAPTRDDFKAVYRQLMTWDTIKKESVPLMDLTEAIQADESIFKALLCIKVFSEVGLMSFELTDSTLYFKMNQIDQGKKVELEQSKLYNELVRSNV